MVKTINRLLGNTSGNVTLRRSERLFAVEGAGFALTTKRIDAIYPDYERLIPSEGPNVVTISRARLREASHVLRRWLTRRSKRPSSACAGTPTDCTERA